MVNAIGCGAAGVSSLGRESREYRKQHIEAAKQRREMDGYQEYVAAPQLTRL
jgi:hypothetical protein